MSLQAGQRLGAYEILGALGAGGMGEVYRARDSKLDRDVALKVLPLALRENPDALARFEREAKAVAALSHRNIMAIYDFGQQDGVYYAVAELLDGETLRDALKDGPLPARVATDYARMTARGLAAAHDGGIVHRDLKPENLFVTREGRIKILDFGLARTTEKAEQANANTPTFTHLTGADTVLGTVHYMSPEQARAEPAGPTSDIFSLGAVLFECLAGHRPFERETVPETMTAILREDPADFPPGIPPAIERIVMRCLEKKPERRFQSAADLAFALENASAESSGASGSIRAAPMDPSTKPRRSARTVPIASALVLGLALGLAAGWFLKGRLAPTPAPAPVRTVPIGFSGIAAHPDGAPDGTAVAFGAQSGDWRGIRIKQLAGGGEAELTTGQDKMPRFSPDGSSILFSRTEGNETSIHRVARIGGAPRRLLPNAAEADWSPDGSQIVFVKTDGDDGIVSISNADGSNATERAAVAGRTLSSPRWSPDGRRIAFISSTRNNTLPQSIEILELDSGEVRRLGPERPSLSGVAWDGAGEHLVFGWSDDLLAGVGSTTARVSRIRLRDGATTDLFWANNIVQNQRGTRLDVVADGKVVFGTFALAQNLAEDSLDGSPGTERTVTDGNSVDRQPVYSPDGATILFSSNRSGHLDLWTFNRETGKLAALTEDAAGDWDPAFIGDGSRIAWSSDRGGNLEVWIANADGTSARQLTQDGVDAENPTASPDGEWITYITSNPDKRGIWKIRSDGTDAQRILDASAYTPQLSPDGTYLAFPSSVSGQSAFVNVMDMRSGEVTRFSPQLLGDVARTGFSYGRPRWLPDGSAIAYVGSDGDSVGVYVQDFVPGQDTTATHRKLIGFGEEANVESFDISPDGSRIALSRFYSRASVMMAEGVPLVTKPRAPNP